jgi:hypothetical protein
MRRTIADELKDEGRKIGEVQACRRTLLRLLRQRFGDVPPEIVATIEATESVRKLETWLGRILTAATLEEMKIGPAT